MIDEAVSIDGRMIRVRSCTEKRGLWIEMFFPQRKKDSLDKLVEIITGKEDKQFSDEREPDCFIFIPGDIRNCVAEMLTDTELYVDIDEGDPQ